MLLPVNWLKEYIDIDENSKTLADNLTLSGSHVESIIDLNKGIENVVIGKIEKLEKHEESDKLFITIIDIGKEKLQIVTAATNVKEGDYVPVALVGAKLANGIYIDKTSLVGVDSYGMLCSLSELGYMDQVIAKEYKDGIFIFDGEYPLGTDVVEIFGLNGKVIELEITHNRPDCLSIIGMARETAATFNKKLKFPKIKLSKESGDIKDHIESVKVHEELCNRYYTRIIKDITIEDSPLWLQTKLMEAGVRPINSIVDVTNYVMLELGQPLHAFDLDKLEGKSIVVREAKDGESIKTIDEVERKLSPSDLIIADKKGPIAIAGIMGGIDTEVTEETKTILLESANFNSSSVRLSSKNLKLRTEASTRFEKGIDFNLCETAAERACQIIEEIGAGTIVKEKIDVYENIRTIETISLRPKKVNSILGTELNTEEMVKYLERLELKTYLKDDKLSVKIPTYRLDLKTEIDLVEEIGRLYGFHNIKTKPLVGVLTRGEKPYYRVVEDKTKDILQGMGINEIMTYSFISPKLYDKLKIGEDSPLRDYIEIKNPLGEDYSVMRTTLIPNVLSLLSHNYNYGVEECFVYEIGNIFIPKEIPVNSLPIEKKVLSIGMYGDTDFYNIKEIVEILFERLGIKGCEYIPEKNNNSYHPNRTANIVYKGRNIGTIGEIHVDVLENYDMNKKVYMADLDFDRIIKKSILERKYKPLPKYPAVARDLAIVVDKDILVGDLEKVIWENGEDLIESINLFDVYAGDQILENKKSLAFSINYRSYEKTLKDKEVNKIHGNIIRKLEDRFDGELRI